MLRLEGALDLSALQLQSLSFQMRILRPMAGRASVPVLSALQAFYPSNTIESGLLCIAVRSFVDDLSREDHALARPLESSSQGSVSMRPCAAGHILIDYFVRNDPYSPVSPGWHAAPLATQSRTLYG